jgi:hypothetical protein
MGGNGSGSYYRYNKKTSAEDCRQIDINRLKKDGCLRSGNVFTTTWTSSMGNKNSIQSFVFRDHIRITYCITRFTGEKVDVDYNVNLTWTPCNFGGERLWFICPGKNCERRVGKLYMGDKYFLCRHCNKLTYESRRNTEADRLASKAHKIRAKLGTEYGFANPIPDRPKGMHWKTYIRLKALAYHYEELSWKQAAKQFGMDFGFG